MGRWLILFGIVLVVLGVASPWIARLGVGRLPGDFLIQRENWSFYFPLTTSLIACLVVSVLLWLFRR